MSTLLLMRENIEKLCNYHTQIKKIKLIIFYSLQVNKIYCIHDAEFFQKIQDIQ